jgi:hypothetical protein
LFLVPVLGKNIGKKSGSKLGKLYSFSGLSSWVMVFLIASDKQSLKSILFLSHFVSVGAKTVTDLCEEILARNYLRGVVGLQKFTKHNTPKHANAFILKWSLLSTLQEKMCCLVFYTWRRMIQNHICKLVADVPKTEFF